mmetsp:Transcript_35381/g.87926  ORF Transcript_35381/g.87926 Transcript_35381/m.87926 type:complete len:87 (-) Transcript_35381:112-372(-)
MATALPASSTTVSTTTKKEETIIGRGERRGDEAREEVQGGTDDRAARDASVRSERSPTAMRQIRNPAELQPPRVAHMRVFTGPHKE